MSSWLNKLISKALRFLIRSALLSNNAEEEEGEQEISADAEEDALLFCNWLLESRQPAINQHLTFRRSGDSGKACDNNSQQNSLNSHSEFCCGYY